MMRRVGLNSFCLFAVVCLVSWFAAPACTPEKPAGEHTGHDAAGHEHGTKDVPAVKKLSANGYTTPSDVSIHNKVPQDIGDIKDLMAAATVDWTAVQVLYEKGKHSVKSDGSIRTLNGFASTPDNFIKYSPDAAAYFKTNGICQLAPASGLECTEGKWVDELIEAYAINGKGPFADASDKSRAAVVKSGLLVLMSYWVRLEFGKALAKVKDGNYEPLGGAPHNWDEAFAFYWGPEGKHSLYAAAENLSTKYNLETSVNKAFFAALIDGLKKMLDDKASPQEAADAANKQLLRLFILGALDAAKEFDDAADAAAKAAARWRGFGYWQAIGHAIAKADKEAAGTFAGVFFTKKIEADALTAIKAAVNASLSGLGMTAADFGDALK